MRIDSVWCAVAVDENGDEGIIGKLRRDGTWMPLVAADEARLADIVPMAEEIAREFRQVVRIIRLTTREEVRVIDGRH